MEALDQWEKDLEIKKEAEDLKRLEDSEGWSRLLVRLERHLIRAEKVKAEHLRSRRLDEAYGLQKYIDGIHFVMDEPYRTISAANPSDGEKNEEQ